jgi:hypothetical protein
MTKAEHFKEEWRLGDDEVINVALSQGRTNDYWLRVTISKAKPGSRLDNSPI